MSQTGQWAAYGMETSQEVLLGVKNGGLWPEIANGNFNDERLSAFDAKAVHDICCSRRRSQRSSLKTVSLFPFCKQKPLFTLRVRAESPAHRRCLFSPHSCALFLFRKHIHAFDRSRAGASAKRLCLLCHGGREFLSAKQCFLHCSHEISYNTVREIERVNAEVCLILPSKYQFKAPPLRGRARLWRLAKTPARERTAWRKENKMQVNSAFNNCHPDKRTGNF